MKIVSVFCLAVAVALSSGAHTLDVAPQTVKGATSRKVCALTGTWTADDGTEVVGPKIVVEVATPLARLPHFVRR